MTPLGCHCERSEAISRQFGYGSFTLVQTIGAMLLVFLLATSASSVAQSTTPCGRFTTEAVAQPAPRGAESALRRFEMIKSAVSSQPYRVLFLGDSLTERFPQDAPLVWNAQMVPRMVLNAGVNGDRTEHLLWRLQHGNLGGPQPLVAVMLIGTNDLTTGDNPRSPELVAEGIRANLLYLRQRLPGTRILLLGLLPRGGSPEARLRLGTVEVNRLIASCADNRSIFWADIGGALLDPDQRLSRDVAPDLLHFSPLGYERLAKRLTPEIDRLLAGR
jgi:lysophospholipase L1-like esterase